MERRKHKVVLIDDDPEDAEFTIHTLSKLDAFEIEYIDDGAAALNHLFDDSKQKPELIILDLKMPKVDGIEILSMLKSDPVKCKIPVFALISSIQGKLYVESFQLKADGYLMKPADCQNFLTLLCQAGLSDFSATTSWSAEIN